MKGPLYFEDLTVGDRIDTESETVSEEEIVAFARKFDPQYFHCDKASAQDSRFGGLIASGFHTLSLSFALFFRLKLFEEANLGSPGMDRVRWLKPLRPGDTIRVAATVKELRPSRSKPDRGVILMCHETLNQRDEVVLSVDCMHLLRRRAPQPQNPASD